MDNTLSIVFMNQCRQVLLQLFHGHKMFRDFCFCYGILHFHMLKQKVIYCDLLLISPPDYNSTCHALHRDSTK